MKKLLLLLFVSLSYCCKYDRSKQVDPVKRIHGEIAEKAMVVSAKKEASQIGLEILKKGGNAFDAAFATEMALAVVYPNAGNLGGGGFLVYRLNSGEIGSLDYREKAPLAATRNMYLDKEGNVQSNLSTSGGLAVGVPGTVAGMFEMHKKFGSLPIKDILAPVIMLARNGYVVSDKQAAHLKDHRKVIIAANNKDNLYVNNYITGDTIKNDALANTLERIAKNGRDEFYIGETAQKMIAYLKAQQAIITLEDLKAYESKWRKPITIEYKDLRLIAMPPPSSGGIVLGQILKMIEDYPLKDYGQNSVKTIQVLTEAERRAYADRSFYLGDPDFMGIPVDTLLSDAYLKERMENFSFDAATLSSDINFGEIAGYESDETTHYSIVDQFGNAIAATTTLNGNYGSKLYVDELGFFLNNEMDDFSAKPGVPNMFGLVGAEANAIAPGKRMLSSMTPTIVEKDGALYMSLGSPGGSTIITSVLQTILNVTEFDLSMQEAVNAPRFHHQWLPDEVVFEPKAFHEKLLDSLSAKGYNIYEKNSRIIGKVDAILVLPDGRLEGGADKRGDDAAVGF